MIRLAEFFLASETSLINVVEKIKTYILCQKHFPPNRTF